MTEDVNIEAKCRKKTLKVVIELELPEDGFPEWFPDNPYPESVFTMTEEEYVNEVQDEKLRTRISGLMARFGWKVCANQMLSYLKQMALDQQDENHPCKKFLSDTSVISRCPVCGGKGISRELASNGNVIERCENGCKYPVEDAV